MEPKLYIDEKTDERFYNVAHAAQIIGAVTGETLRAWALHGSTPFGFELDVRREAMIHEPKGFRHEARRHLQDRMLLPEQQVLALKEILRDFPRRPGPVSSSDMAALEDASRRYRRLRQPSKNSHTPSA